MLQGESAEQRVLHVSCYRESQQNNVYWWRYCIRLENLGEATVQLRERNWRIFSLSGTLETVRGRGVVGQVSHGAMESV